jgi:hypothetical protein
VRGGAALSRHGLSEMKRGEHVAGLHLLRFCARSFL